MYTGRPRHGCLPGTISNLTYDGVHRPVLGWTLLTLAGLCLTASGIVFQLRRGQVRSFVAGVRATLAEWD